MKVIIRPLTIEDSVKVVKWRNDPLILEQMFNDNGPTMDQHISWFKNYENDDTRQEFIICVVDDGIETPVGTIGLSAIDMKNKKAEYGILIGDNTFRGKGIAYEASRLILDYAFKELNLNKVYLRVMVSNKRAKYLYDKLGFLEEGVLQAEYCKNNRFVDIYYMGILKDEWNKL